MAVSGGEVNISNSMVYGYEEMWLSQTGGTVNVRNSELHKRRLGGELHRGYRRSRAVGRRGS